MPERRHTSVDSPSSSRWLSSGAISPGTAPFWLENGASEVSRTAPHRSSVASEDVFSHRGSYDHSMFTNDDFAMEEGQMSNLNIHDRSPGSPKAGSKRRASSPPRDRDDRSSVSSLSGHSEIYHRRSMQQLPNRSSPVSRYHPNHSSLSSASSLGPRHGSLGSSFGLASVPSSATSYASGRVSPSTAIDSDFRNGLPPAASKAVNPSSVIPQHQRTLSESTQGGARHQPSDSASHSRNSSISQIQGMQICECCPKKPKKFDTEEELRYVRFRRPRVGDCAKRPLLESLPIKAALYEESLLIHSRLHESEKQYTCAYCPNRFKNKNEAERHQNSLHLRRQSWSCAALAGIEAAFHASMSAGGADACGYCGEEFPNPPQWDIRAEHLNHVHKFGECNQAKKFFRADHFRQHLKHSHQGTSGKWTNVLENACMKDEPLPEKRAVGQAPPALMVTTTGLGNTGPNPGGPGTIEETPHDS